MLNAQEWAGFDIIMNQWCLGVPYHDTHIYMGATLPPPGPASDSNNKTELFPRDSARVPNAF